MTKTTPKSITIAEFAKRYRISEFKAARIMRDMERGEFPGLPKISNAEIAANIELTTKPSRR